MTRTLLKMYWQMARNTFRYAPSKTKGAYIFSGIAVTLILIFFSVFVGGAAARLPDPFIHVVFSYAFAMMLGMVILIGVPQVFKDLYGANELEHLFTLPIPTKNIFWVKYMQSFIAVPGFLWFISIILLTVYGFAAKASPLFFPVAYLAVLAVILIGMAIAYLLNLIMVQIIPAHRAKELMTVMSALAGLFGYLSFQLPSLFMESQEGEFSYSHLPEMPKWFPLTWGATAIAKAKVTDFSFIVPLFLLIFVATILILMATTLVERGFRTGWIRLNEGRRKKKKRRGTKLHNRLFQPIIFIGIKEWRTIQRDMREWLTFLPFLFIILFPFFSLIVNEEARQEITATPLFSWGIAQIMLLFMLSFLGSSFASTTIGREAKAIQLLRVLPISGWQLALGKFWISWLIPTSIIAFFEIGFGLFLHWPVTYILLGITAIALLGLGLTGISLWFGTIGARHNPDNPHQRLKVGVSFILMFVSFIYMGLAISPISLTFIPVEAILETEDVGAGEVLGILAVIARWKLNNHLLVQSIGIVFTLLITVGTAWFTLFLSAIKIDKGINIDMVNKR